MSEWEFQAKGELSWSGLYYPCQTALGTVAPRYNDPRYNDIPEITMNIIREFERHV